MISIYLSVFPSVYLYIYLSSNQSIHLSRYLAICLSLSFHLSIFLYFNLSIYLSIFLSINLYVCNVMIYSSVYVFLDNSIDNGIIEMLFDHDWPEILLQKKHLNQRERTCCLNLNWWNNLNLIVTLSNFWDALPSLVNTEKFIISYGYRKKISLIFLVMLVFQLKISFLLIYMVMIRFVAWALIYSW